MTLAEAATTWEEKKRVIEEAEPQLKAAREVLLEHFRKTGRATYKGRIGYSKSFVNFLDQDKVKRDLGKRLPKFMKRTPRETLSLLT